MDSIIRAAEAFGLGSSIFLAGINVGASHLTMPILYTRPVSISTPIFNELYTRGAVTLVPLSIVSASSSALVAYLLPSQRGLWATAAVATISQLPWTVLAMMPTNDRLNALATSKEEQEKASTEEVVGLLKKWRWMNIVRGSLALVGGVSALYALLEE